MYIIINIGIFLVCAAIILLLIAAFDDDDIPWYAFFGLVALVVIGGINFWQSQPPEEKAAEEAKHAAWVAERERPRKIQEIDGCTIYSFYRENPGRTYYFTNCKDTVTTDNSHSERHGKTTREVQESIVTHKK